MILNSFEFDLTEQKIDKIRAAIIEADKKKSDASISPILLKIELNSLNALLNDLMEQRSFYLKIIRDFKNRIPVKEDAVKFPENLVYMRIANNISQEEIAAILKTNVEEIKRHEAYLNKNLETASLLKINDYLEEKISNNLNNDFSKVCWNEFPIKEMLKRESLPSEVANPISYIKELIAEIFGYGRYEVVLHKKSNFNGNLPNTYSLFAWQIRVLHKAKEIIKRNQISSLAKDPAWLNELARISTSPTGPIDAQNFLLSKGIILIVEPHFPYTYLDGAAMLLPNTSIPVIGLTLRHDRLDNFWFVLFHELGHIFLHLNEERSIIFDEEIELSEGEIEVEADEFALENLISSEKWDGCISRFYQDVDRLNEDARKLNIHPSIIAGRIRNEENNYKIFNEQVGSKQVRKLFWSDEYDS